MDIRFAEEKDYRQLAEMKWIHCGEDDNDYNEHNLDGVEKQDFINEFIVFLREHREYKIFTAEQAGIILSAMFVYIIPKTPKPNGHAKYIAYLTNVFTLREYRNKGIGTALLSKVKDHLTEIQCELVFAFPAENSVHWYERNGFYNKNEIFQCDLMEE